MIRFQPSLYVSLSLCALIFPGLSAIAPTTAEAIPLSAVKARQVLKTAGDYRDPRYLPSAAQRSGTVVIRSPLVDSDSAFFCTGTVVSPTQIVTAAHCVDFHDPRSPDFGIAGQTEVHFGGLSGPARAATNINIHPLYFDETVGFPMQGAFAAGDIAVLTLNAPAPAGTRTYGLYDGNAIGQVATHIGYGTTGNGDGSVTEFSLDNLENGRIGKNFYETDLTGLLGIGLEGAQLIYDFDDGTRAHNALPWWASTDETILSDGSIFVEPVTDRFQGRGLRLDEVLIDAGDSGGGAFIDGLLAGVHSFGFTLEDEYCDGILNPDPSNPYNTAGAFNPEIVNSPDIDCELNSTFGEISGDTNVAFFHDWLSELIHNSNGPDPNPGSDPALVSAPATVGLMGIGLLFLGLRPRRRYI
ncbi:trypsin-like serine protease [Pedomonas mirosovicensis]|uniref:trypsin-like serine protease n=1 Tax=Pedomonas mirosovicensis TaxID=2908641 RepID=UPI002168D698|nr:trypsin-like serine protease [Pedomonas mirosovicensis]MCH8684149.1 trypsin-like serine protease [Pedomonas mirosovicensis]